MSTPLLTAEVTFGGLNLNKTDLLLFEAETENPGDKSFSTLFSAQLGTGDLRQLSFFPEKLIYLSQSGRIQIQNRFGVFRIGRDFGPPLPVKEFPSFISGEEVESGKLQQVASSPDGRYLLYLEPTSTAYADLILLDIDEGKKKVISRDLTLSFDNAMVDWSPDSRFFIYQKGTMLYYYSMDQMIRDEVLAEGLRLLGQGSLRSIMWGPQNYLFYVQNSVLYRIHSAEFFTRSFYNDLLDAGQVVGKIPFRFDSNFDSFYISPDGEKLLFSKGGRNLILYFLKEDDYISTGSTMSLPYLYLPRNTRISRLLWSDSDVITLLTGSIRSGQDSSRIFRISLYADGEERLNEPLYFSKMSEKNVKDMVLSPRKEQVAILFADRVEVRDYRSWEIKSTLRHAEPLHAVWTAEEQLVVAGTNTVELYELDESVELFLITLSQVETYGYDEGGELYARSLDSLFRFNEEDGWIRSESDEVELLPAKVVSDKYRVYLRVNPGEGNYKNMVMVRHTNEYTTTTLNKNTGHAYEAFPEKEEPVDFVNFNHGSRIRRREVSLVFNAVDSVEGLTDILADLKEYGITATFFVNGEFMRRNPDAVKELANSDHEVGSLFFTYFNMTDSRYRISTDFIRQGLARNENQYFNLTSENTDRGQELALLWHAPYYFVNSQIIAASREMNYTYVGYDVDSLDWVPKTENRDGMYMSVPDLIQRIMNKKKPGSIIPIRIGSIEGGRDDYLFQHMDVLINGLIERGYRIVPVSTLIEHAK